MSTSPATSASTRASSKAESPPPTTTRRLPWKNGPSHEAHRDTPRPANSASPGIPSSRRADPAARMIARACRVPSLEAMANPSSAGSIPSASPSMNSAPAASPSAMRVTPSSKPATGSSKPGAWVMPSTVETCPPTPKPSRTMTLAPPAAPALAAVSPAMPAPMIAMSYVLISPSPPVIDGDRRQLARSHDLPISVRFAADDDDVDVGGRVHLDLLVVRRLQLRGQRLLAEGGARVEVVLHDLQVPVAPGGHGGRLDDPFDELLLGREPTPVDELLGNDRVEQEGRPAERVGGTQHVGDVFAPVSLAES